MTLYQTCATCQLWQSPSRGELHGECHAVLNAIDDADKFYDDTPVFIDIHASRRHASKVMLMTLPTFGCVLHVAKETADPRVRQD